MGNLLSFNMTKEENDLFRNQNLPADTRLASITMLILVLPLLAFIYNDYAFLGPVLSFYCVAGARVLIAVLMLATIFFLRRNRNYQTFDVVITVWSAIALFILILISFSRPVNYLGHAVIDVIIIMIIYLALPNRMINKTLLCLAFTITEAVILYIDRSQFEGPLLFTIFCAFLVANAAGFISAWNLEALRRREFCSGVEIGRVSDELKRLSETDDLTGIYNGRAFHRISTDELARFRRYQRPLSFIMLDLDHFKLINDGHGHMMGDVVLREVAGTIKSQLREVDIVGRLGGEEFGILLPETLLEEARMVAERVNDALHRMSVTADGGVRLNVTASLGVTEAVTNDDNMDSLVARADKALYRAKANGRDRVETLSLS